MPTESFFTQSSLAYIASAGASKDGKAYSIKPADGTGDFTFSRGSNLAATRVGAGPNFYIEKGRENLLLQSNQFDTTWTTSNSSVTSGQSGYDGSSDAWLLENVSGAGAFVKQDKSVNGLQTASVYAKSGNVDFVYFRLGGSSSRGLFVDLSNGTLSSTFGTLIDYNIDSVGNGWYRISVTYQVNLTNTRIYASASGGTSTSLGDNILIQDAQVEVGLAATEVIETTTTTGTAGILEDTPRFDYSGMVTCPSLLLEPLRTNLFPNSEYFSSWQVFRGSLTANSISSPEGVVNAYRYEENSDTGQHFVRFQSISMTSGTDYTASVFVKAGELTYIVLGSNSASLWNPSTTTFNLSTGSVTSGGGTIEPIGNDGWYRCIISGECLTTTSSAGLEITTSGGAGSTGDGLYIYGAQLEQGAYPTSYIPTYGTSVTRAADSCNGAGNANTFNSTEGVLYAEFSGLVNAEDYRIISLNAGDSANSIFIGIRNDTGNVYMYMPLDGTSYISSVNATNTNVKVALKYKTNDVSFYINGVKVFSDSSVTLPVGLSKLDFNYGNVSNSYPFYGNVKQLLVFNTALSDADLATLTTI